MPCCAFALFVIGQIAAFCVAVGHALGLQGARTTQPVLNPATAWQLHAAPAFAPVRRKGRRRLGPVLVLMALLEVGAVTAGAAWLHSASRAPIAAADAFRCGSPDSQTEVASLGAR